MAPWLETSLAPDWTLPDLAGHLDTGAAVLISDHDATPIGAAVVLLDTPGRRDASIPFIGIDPQRRFRGLGGEAGLALERHLRRRFAIERVYAPVPDGRGLAVYFWLRQGYRPLTTADGPGPLAGLTPEARPGIWLLRDSA
jgi:hypothetical protein